MNICRVVLRGSFEMIARAIQPALEAIEQFIDLILRDDEGRAHRQRLARDGPDNQAFFLAHARCHCRHALFWIEWFFRGLIRDKLNAADQSHTTGFANQIM